MATPLLEIKDLYVHFKLYEGTLKVLDGVNFKVKRKGEAVGLIGEAGCGKTTTMSAVLRILPIPPARLVEGEIFFMGKDILKMKAKELGMLRRKNISMIFQDPTAALNPVFKIGTQLRDVIRYANIRRGGKRLPKDEIKARAIKLLNSIALPDPERILENYPVMLSGGMRQRVCIALALSSGSDLLIADEPGTSLDVTIQDQILRLIHQLVKERDLSVILVSHALGAVRGLVDRVYVMYAGNMVESAETEELFSNPLHPYTQGLVRAVPKLTGGGIPEGIGGRIPDYINPPKGCRFYPRCANATPICKKSKPSFFEVGKEHEVACFLFRR